MIWLFLLRFVLYFIDKSRKRESLTKVDQLGSSKWR